MRRACALLFSLVAVLFETGCEKTVVNRGYAMDSADFSKILIGKDDAQAVFDKVGSPTISSSVEDEKGGYSWYYVSKKTEKNGFLDPKVIDQETMIVSFDSNGVVRSINKSTYEKNIKIVRDQTKAGGKGAGIIGETFDGLGKYMKRYSGKHD